MFRTIFNGLMVILVVFAIAFLGYNVLNKQDERTTSEKIGDSIDALGDGVDKAGQEMENRTPGEKLNDAVNNIRDDIREETKP